MIKIENNFYEKLIITIGNHITTPKYKNISSHIIKSKKPLYVMGAFKTRSNT